jgi:hypothetical protein
MTWKVTSRPQLRYTESTGPPPYTVSVRLCAHTQTMSNQSTTTVLANLSAATGNGPLLDLDVFCTTSNATDTVSLAICTLSQALSDSILNQTTTTMKTTTTPSEAETESASLDIAMFVLLAVRTRCQNGQPSARTDTLPKMDEFVFHTIVFSLATPSLSLACTIHTPTRSRAFSFYSCR